MSVEMRMAVFGKAGRRGSCKGVETGFRRSLLLTRFNPRLLRLLAWLRGLCSDGHSQPLIVAA